jgi:hypothetical protein
VEPAGLTEPEPAETVIRPTEDPEKEPTADVEWPRKEKGVGMETTSQLSKVLSDIPSEVLRGRGPEAHAVRAGEPSSQADPDDAPRGGGLTDKLSEALSTARDKITEKARDLLPHHPVDASRQDTIVAAVVHDDGQTSKMDRDDEEAKIVSSPTTE